ncbi:glycerol-3-phosphate acyltransferase [Paenibacillus qinlingensis]|uniref:Acyl-phosphate glycerol 3-phosphate acyltransferase n=1 Tax=Paenibacillus qinlingensis TaxID=1837343 RepID=A0ABU1NUJ5_9BACL|nr:glycerol-3-phosphate acyltransferase [Paenibacillus qinlingensis]MDR6551160.1 acyl-phosphate glycerol 3-phosphate acyltransferase [Paenibacillus qinlingensis]
MIILWTLCAFVSGALMFSYWLGRLARKNLQTVGDGNPGALNLWKAAGYRLGIVGILLDFAKGYVVILLAVEAGGMSGYGLIPIALAPIFGHAFSPFLRGKGGKAIAVTFGVWSGLTQFEVSLALAVILAVMLGGMKVINKWKPISSEVDGQQVVIGMLLLGVYLYVRDAAADLLWVWGGNTLLIMLKHHKELRALLRRKRKQGEGSAD